MWFAALAALVTIGSAWLAHDRVRVALTRDFERRLARLAATTASQIEPSLVSEVRERGQEGSAYLAAQVQLATLRAATDVESASLVDTARITIVDASDSTAREGARTPYDALAPAALARALAGRIALSDPFVRDGRTMRACFAPVGEPGEATTGVVAVEAAAAYIPVLADLGRTLALIALISVAAIAALAALIVRSTRAAALLERRLSRAENLAAMGRLTATLAHEIKNPLAIIRGSAERLRKLEPEARRMADFVIEESDRLSRTVARYLQFARVELADDHAGDAIAALDATLDLLDGELRARSITVERAGAAGSAPCTLDNESLKQVYLNLVWNALEALGEGGHLRVVVSDLSTASGSVEVTIADDGPGIPSDVLARVGSPFFTTKAQGSGLGIFLARRLAESAGGRLDLESRPGHGTTCRLRVPMRRG